MKNILKYPLILLFALFILGMTAFDMTQTNRVFSEMENKFLQQQPTFTWKSFYNNEYSPKYETYINEQFVFRDNWISLKSISESALGKIENNGIIYGKDGYMFERFDTVDSQRTETNLRYIQQFLDKTDLPTTFAIIPNSYTVLSDYLPTGLITADQTTMTQQLFDTLTDDNLTTLTLEPSMQAHKDEYIYYRTDHHWTTLGAYYGYSGFVTSKGLTPVPLEDLEAYKQIVEPFYGTYFSKAKKVGAATDVLTYYNVPITSIAIDGEEVEMLHDLPQFEKRDAYAGFLHGNNGLTVIKSENNLNKREGETSRILVVKDSYANSFLPFLTYNYDEVYVIDLRGLIPKMSEVMAQNTFDEVLIMYNFKNFVTDVNIAKLTF